MIRSLARLALIALLGGCRSEKHGDSSDSPVAVDTSDDQRLALCVSAGAYVAARFKEARQHFDAASWNALVSRVDGDSRATLAGAGERLAEAQRLNRNADALIQARGEPFNRGLGPKDVTPEVADLRSAAQRKLAGLDEEIHRVVIRIHGLPEASCLRIQEAPEH